MNKVLDSIAAKEYLLWVMNSKPSVARYCDHHCLDMLKAFTCVQLHVKTVYKRKDQQQLDQNCNLTLFSPVGKSIMGKSIDKVSLAKWILNTLITVNFWSAISCQNPFMIKMWHSAVLLYVYQLWKLFTHPADSKKGKHCFSGITYANKMHSHVLNAVVTLNNTFILKLLLCNTIGCL